MVSFHHQCRRDSDAVVRAQRRPVGAHPVIVDAVVDATLAWIERARGLALADDVEVRLEDDDGCVLATGCLGNAHDSKKRSHRSTGSSKWLTAAA